MFKYRSFIKKFFELPEKNPSESLVSSTTFLRESLNSKNPLVILDVGANRGQSAYRYLNLFPGCHIHSFEPFKESYDILKQIPYNNLSTYQYGLSDRNEIRTFYLNGESPTNSLLKIDDRARDVWGDLAALKPKSITTCEFRTLDWFLETHDVTKVNFMKLDVQGAEFKVLNGAKKALEEKKIGLVQIEFLFVPTYQEQKSFDYYIEFFERYNYRLSMITDIERMGDVVFQADLFFIQN